MWENILKILQRYGDVYLEGLAGTLWIAALTVVAERISARGLHGRETPVLLIFFGFPGTLVTDLAGVLVAARSRKGRTGQFDRHISGKSRTRSKCGGNSNGSHGRFGCLTARHVLFIGNDVLLTSGAPNGLESAIHFVNLLKHKKTKLRVARQGSLARKLRREILHIPPPFNLIFIKYI